MNPYDILGIAKNASSADIRDAYRKLAKASHPDLNPGKSEAEARFKELASAYAIIGNDEKRKRYDAGEIDDAGAERPERKFYREYAEPDQASRRDRSSNYERSGDFSDYEDLGDIFSQVFRQAGAQSGRTRQRGRDVKYNLSVDFLEAVNGARKRVELPDGRTIDVTVPPAVSDGQVLRLAGMGSPAGGDGAAGDAFIEINVRPHPMFRREGTTIRSELPITLAEAMAGATVRVETVSGSINLKIPKGTNSGKILRLNGKGVLDPHGGRRGDHLIELRVMLPEPPDEELERIVTEWERQHPYDPRKTAGVNL